MLDSTTSDRAHSAKDQNLVLIPMGETPQLKWTLYPRRWVVLLTFSLIALANGAIWITVLAISTTAKDYYGVSYGDIDKFSTVFMIIFPLSVIPGSYCMGLLRLRTTMLIGALCNCVGAWLRYGGAGRGGYAMNVGGSAVAALAAGFIFVITPRLSALWFGENERNLSTSIGIMTNVLGVAIGFLQPTLMVGAEPKVQELAPTMRALFLSQAVFCSAAVVMVVLFVRDQPPTPPCASQSATMSSQSGATPFCSSLKSNTLHLWGFIKNRAALSVLIASAIYFGASTAFYTALDLILNTYYEGAGYVGTTATLSGAAALPITGLILDRTKAYRAASIGAFVLSATSLSGVALVVRLHGTVVWMFLLAAIYGAAAAVFFAIGTEVMAELSYPIPEHICVTFSQAAGSVAGAVMIEINAPIMSRFGDVYGLVFLIASYIVGMVLVALVNMRFKRSEIDKAETLVTGLYQSSSS